MIKKDLIFLDSYKGMDGIIIFEDEYVHILTKSLQETHLLKEDSEVHTCFKLDSFYDAWKAIHGTRHSFEIHETSLKVFIKKTGEFERVEEIKTASPKKISEVNEGIGEISRESLLYFDLLKEFTLKFQYLSFIKNPTLIFSNNSHIWGTDGIHRLRINFHSTYQSEDFYQIPIEVCKNIANFAENVKKETFTVELKGNLFAISNIEKGEILDQVIIKIIKTNNTLEYPMIKEKEWKVCAEELEELKQLNLKTLLSSINKEKKNTYEVFMRLEKGVLYLNDERIFEFREKMTIDRAFQAYKFMRFIKDVKGISIATSYLRNNDAILIL